jgi:hypothetical protein
MCDIVHDLAPGRFHLPRSSCSVSQPGWVLTSAGVEAHLCRAVDKQVSEWMTIPQWSRNKRNLIGMPGYGGKRNEELAPESFHAGVETAGQVGRYLFWMV